MSATLRCKPLVLSLGLLLAGAGAKTWAVELAPATDAGMTSASKPANVTLFLKLRNEAALESYVRQTVTPGSAHYLQFLTTRHFAQQFGATDEDIARVQEYLQRQGLHGEVLPSHVAIRVSGTLGQFEQLFQTSIHDYVASGSGRHFHKPVQPLQMPSAIADVVDMATGLSTEHAYRPHRLSAPALRGNIQALPLAKPAVGNSTATGIPGQYTVGDVANLYDINPLYKHGVVGKGATVGIVTLSNFYPSDATTYWSDIGLATRQNRIRQMHVDGGGAIDSGSGETAIAVEQAGGIAPWADVIVYDAPNTTEGYLDAFAQAVSDNVADSLSTSWGSPEFFSFAAWAGGDPSDTTDVGDLRAFHTLFLEAAAQGQSLFAAAGDSGAYDVNPYFSDAVGYSVPLSVDSPASDPYITAAGGTTVPYRYAFGNGPEESITQESVWGWDYIQNYYATYLNQGVSLFSAGGGGGVSVYWPTPFYQRATSGIQTSQPGQAVVFCDLLGGCTTILNMPSDFAGRNLPDISLDADPETGYVYVSTTDGGLKSGEGGTSFVSAQLNGINALLRQSAGHRIGWWNPQIYALQHIVGYGKFSPFRSVRAGDNWFYQGAPQYNPGAGIGSLDVAKLAAFLRVGF